VRADTPAPVADLSIVKSDFSTTYTPGNPDTYTITVTNNGPSAVSGAVVTDVLPSGTTDPTPGNNSSADTVTPLYAAGQVAPTGTTCDQYLKYTATNFQDYYASQGGVIQYGEKGLRSARRTPECSSIRLDVRVP
jgi:uncharacterized repeat protein (TIGR01451 family)